jgi:CheY-like chemotaxis protein
MYRILLIDDETVFTDYLKGYVGRQYPGISMTVCNDPLQALRLLQQNSYDLVLIDIEMPVMDGRKLLRFSQQAGVERSRIVMLSGHTADHLHEICPVGSCLAVLNKFETRQREVLDMIFASLSAKSEGMI